MVLLCLLYLSVKLVTMANAGTSQTKSTFEQVRDARDTYPRRGIIIIIGYDDYKSTIASLLQSTPNVTDKYSIINVEYFPLPGANFLHTSLSEVRRWISASSLRRLDGCQVKVIWALSLAAAVSKSMTLMNQRDIIFMTFNNYRQHIIVVTEGSSEEIASLGPDYCTVISEAIPSSILSAVEKTKVLCISTDIRVDGTGKSLQDITAWSAERVILFGRTGSGKSTVAHMLTKGSLDIPADEFKHGSNAKGVTRNVRRGQGRGWLVTDTPGFGETEKGTVSTSQAVDILKNFVSKIGGIHSYYVYVLQKARLDRYDEKLWEFFTKVFPNATRNFCIIVTCQEDDFTEEDKTILRNKFKASKKLIYVNFESPLDDQDKTERAIMRRKRNSKQSLERLERELANMKATDTACHRNNLSADHLSHMKSKTSALAETMIQADILPGAVLEIIHKFVQQPIRHIISKVRGGDEIDESFILLPQ